MKKLREQLGLSQIDVARLIGMSQTKASYCKHGLRQLNPKELHILSQLELLLDGQDDISTRDQFQLQEQKSVTVLIKKLEFENQQNENRCKILQEKLSKMLAIYTANKRLWSFLLRMKKHPDLLAKVPFAPVLEINCLDKLKTCGLDEQIRLRHQITVLKAEIKSGTKMIRAYRHFK